MAKIIIDIQNCKQCPNFTTENQCSTDGFDKMEDWKCIISNKIIQGAVEWHEEDEIKIPDWCPIKTDEDIDTRTELRISSYKNNKWVLERKLQPLSTWVEYGTRVYYNYFEALRELHRLLTEHPTWYKS